MSKSRDIEAAALTRALELEERVRRLERILCAHLLTERLNEYPDSTERKELSELALELDARLPRVELVGELDDL